MRTNSAAARVGWETRDEGDDTVQGGDGITEIRTAVQSLTTTVEQRLGTLDSALAEIRGRVDHTETVLRRPGAAPENRGDETPIEVRAFDTFIRRGREGLEPTEIRALRVSDDTAGGFLAPDQFIAELDRNLVPFSPVRQIARVRPISAPAAVIPKRTGGMTARWVGEIEERPETTITFGNNRYEVREIAAYVDVSNQLLEDAAIDVADELAFAFAEEFGAKEGTAFVNGIGALDPVGFMNDPNVPYTASGSAGAVTADGLIDLYHALPSAYRANATWGMNSTALGAFRKLKDSSGAYLLLTAGLNGAPVTTLLGRPVVELPDMPNVAADAFPVIFGDFMQGYRIFDRIALSILRDPYSMAKFGQTRFHGRRRVAGGVAKADALRKLKVAVS